ncbi:MAG: site-specific integrase [Candidatus Tumulicola sp.]
MNDLNERYIAHRVARCGVATVKRYRELAAAIGHHIGTIGIRNLSSLAVEQAYAKLAESWAPQTVLHAHRFTKSAFKWAVAKNLLLRSPFESVETPIVPRREVRYLSPPEARSVLEAATTRRHHAAFLFALLTGARRGEVAALSWDDVDFERALITIRRSYTDVTGEMVLKSTKSGRVRKVALSPRAVELLRQQRVKLMEERRAAAPGSYSDCNLVFPNETGRPTKLHALTDAFKVASRAAGVTDASLHSLRHTSGTWMVAQGSDVRSVQEILGHSEPSTTLNIYSHAVPELQVRAVATIDATLDSGFSRQERV